VIVTPVALDAVTVNVDELPVTIDVGFAVIVTVGDGFGVTVTVAASLVVPPGPVAVAVYVVVTVGVTACDPPVPVRVYELPSDPATVTVVAADAVTVKVDVLPETIEGGVAAMVTVGTGFALTVTAAVAVIVPPGPVAVTV
jgi:hypothetical protein